jgi:hypothetical protein
MTGYNRVTLTSSLPFMYIQQGPKHPKIKTFVKDVKDPHINGDVSQRVEQSPP